jgi:hypothetical protein
MADEELDIISLDMNLSDVERPPDVPVGRYIGEIQNIEVKTSGQGNDYFAMRVLVPAENIPADIVEHYEDGALFFYNRLLVPKGNDRRALWNLRQFVEKLGLSSETNEIDPNEWMNQRIGLVIGTEKNLEGETRSAIRSLFAAEEGVPQTEEADEPAEEEKEEVKAPASKTRAARGGGARRR